MFDRQKIGLGLLESKKNSVKLDKEGMKFKAKLSPFYRFDNQLLENDFERIEESIKKQHLYQLLPLFIPSSC